MSLESFLEGFGVLGIWGVRVHFRALQLSGSGKLSGKAPTLKPSKTRQLPRNADRTVKSTRL